MKSPKRLEGSYIPENQMNLIFESRMVWRDLATWIHAYLISVYSNFDNKSAVEEKIDAMVSKNGYIIGLIFGQQNEEQYVQLLSEYVSPFKELVDAQINGEDVDEYIERLYENGNQGAAFFSRVNPFWLESEWKTLIHQFIQMNIDESTAFLNKDYVKNIEIYDRNLKQALKMGDCYSKGLIEYLTYARK